jgi:F-type H+-transporting ATPase subunit b
MLIDWFTVGAQALNFIILVWLLKHFLYKPILNAIDGRENHIAAELADANSKKAEAQRDRDEFQKKNRDFDEQRAALLGKATDEANAERGRIVGDAHKEADAMKASQEKALRSSLASMGGEITRRASEEVFGIARKALGDLATVSLEERMGEVFTRRLRQMSGKAKETLSGAIKASSDPVVVRSAFEMPAAQRAAIQNALNETFSAEVRVRFETETGTLCGIELAAGGQKVGWSIADYLGSLDRSVATLIDAQSGPAGHPSSRPDAVGAPPTEAGVPAGAK